jgi:hypothetical protein
LAQVTINNGDSGGTVRTALNNMFTELYADVLILYPEVATYADLPAASSHTGEDYIVQTATGVWLVNRHPAGLYRSNGTTWNWLGDSDTDAATVSNTPAGNISATTVQAALNELDTEKAALAGATFTGSISATNLSGTNTGDQTSIVGITGSLSDFNTALTGADFASGGGTATGTNTGDQTSIVGITGSLSDFNTALTGADFASGGGTATGTNTGDQTITLTGDVTGSGTGSFAATIAAAAVTLAKMANVATGTIFYRKTAGTGAPEVQTLATLKTDLGLTGTNGGDQTITLTGDVTGSGTGSFAATIANSAVTLAKQADMATASVVYRKTAGAGAPEVNTLATLKTDLGLTGTNSGDQTTVSGQAGFVANSATFDVTGGAAAGSTYNGSAAKTIDYSTVGAQPNAPRLQSVSSASTVTPTFSNDQVNITALAAACQLLNPTGTAVPAKKVIVRIKDDGTARALTYDTQYRALGVTLPTTTVISKTLYLGFIYNSTDTKWDCVAVAQEA